MPRAVRRPEQSAWTHDAGPAYPGQVSIAKSSCVIFLSASDDIADSHEPKPQVRIVRIVREAHWRSVGLPWTGQGWYSQVKPVVHVAASVREQVQVSWPMALMI